MNEQIGELLSHVRATWRRRWLALLVAWVACLFAWGITLMLPDKYEANARVYVDTQTALKPVLRGIAVDDDLDAQVMLVREALLSRPQLEAVARKTNLDANVRNAGGMDNLINDLQHDLTVTASSTNKQAGLAGRENIYAISYQNPNRAKSVEVVRALLDNFVEGALNGNRSGANAAQAFLKEQIKDYEKRLSAAEARLADFKKRNVGMIPGDKGDYFSRLDKEMSGLQDAETNLAIAASRREELRRQLGAAKVYVPGTSGATGPGGAGATSDITTRIQESEAKLEELLLKYTDRHPEVLALKQTIAELKKREAKEMADLARGGSGTGVIRSLNVNPVYQSIQVQLSQVDVEVASLRGAVAQHQQQIADLRKFVNSAPEVEQEYSRLNRDYGVTKAQYEVLVQRLEQARVSDDAAQSGIARFEVIDPPRADVKPVWPNRPLFIIFGLLGGLVLGVATAFLVHLLIPRFDDLGTLRRKTGMKVLGAVSLIRGAGELMAEKLALKKFWLASGSLVAAGVVLAVGVNFGLRLIHSLLA